MKRASLTEGSILKGILIFAFPMLINSLMQQMFSTVDMYFIGNFIGRNGAAAVGASGVLITCMIGLFTGISTGVGVLAARLFGSRKWKEYIGAALVAKKIGLIFGVIIMIFGWSFMKELLVLFKTPEDILKEALLYARLYLLGLIPMLFFQIYSSLLKAANEAKLPLYSMLIGGAINVVLDAIFILIFNFGIAGASLATVISQWVAAILNGFMYRRYINKKSGISLISKKLNRKEELSLVIKMLQIGLPAGIQAVLLTFSNLIMQYYVNQLGTYEVAAFAAYFKIETMIYLPILAMGQTLLIFVSQNVGAGEKRRVQKGILVGLLLGILVTVILAIGMLFVGERFFWFLIKDANIIPYGKALIFATFPFYFVYAILDLTGNSIRGLGNSLIPMISSILSLCLIRIGIVSLWASKYDELQMIGLVYPITWSICAIMNGLFLLKQWRKIRNEDSVKVSVQNS